MFAETAHTIYKSLPDAERERFIAMMQKDLQAKVKPEKKKIRASNVKTKEEYLDIAFRILTSRKKSINQ